MYNPLLIFFYFYKTLKSLLFPPGIYILLLMLIGIITKERFIRWVSFLGALMLYVLSSEIGESTLKHLVEEKSDNIKGCSYVVVFGSGVSDESIRRVIKGCEISKTYKCPIIPSGHKYEGIFMKDMAENLGCSVPFVDTTSKNTYENVKFVKNILNHADKLVIVSSDYHIKRIKFLLKKEGLKAYVVGVSLPEREDPFLKFLPTYGKFYENMRYINELVGILFFILKI